MTHFETTETHAQPGILAGIIQRLKTRAQQRQNRAAFQHLLALDADILKDIGVTRGDVVWANNLPIEVNAAQELEKTRLRSRMRV